MSHNLHRETHLGLARSPKKNRTGNTRRDLQPAMPSYGEGRLKIAASNLPPPNPAPPPEKRHQVNKKAERSSEAYPTPQTQSANTKTQTTAMLTWRKGRQQEGHTTEHTPTLKSSRHQHAPRRPRHTHGWDNPRALPPQTTTGRGENPLTKVQDMPPP
ncbi:BnaC03g27110D [Brassica napus]|uniref:BnaC03g27110D protein n=1 Tax=Brassica napus TaxID=3708 RepID=A0A078G7V1_BRANA|nr:BnaC03g27110D [Brassica napus]